MDIVLSRDAQKQYKHLPKSEQAKIRKKLKTLQQTPYAGKKLGGELEDFRSLHAWPYRIIYEVSAKEKRIDVHKIAYLQGVYR